MKPAMISIFFLVVSSLAGSLAICAIFKDRRVMMAATVGYALITAPIAIKLMMVDGPSREDKRPMK